jgi:hypothetical protein
MKTPFSTEQFFSVIENYNAFVFPFQLIILAIGAVLIGLVVSSKHSKIQFPAVFTSLLWIYTGIFYHFFFFTSINPAAWIFGSLFILQGGLMLYETIYKKRLDSATDHKKQRIIGFVFVLYGVIIYPLISYLSEGSIAGAISLGLPCPSTILTFGVFLVYGKNFSRYLLIIPAVWSLIGISAAINFGVYQDFVMPVAAITAVIFLVSDKKSAKTYAEA